MTNAESRGTDAELSALASPSQLLSPEVLANIELGLPIAETIAGSNSLYYVPPDENLSYAYIGLVSLAQSFDPQLGIPFTAYVASRLKYRIRDQYRREMHADRSTEAPQIFTLLSRFATAVSLNIDGDEGEYAYDIPEPSFEDKLLARKEAESRLGQVGWALRLMAGRPKQAFIDYNLHGDTLAEIGSRSGVTEGRASQIVKYATERVRYLLKTSGDLPQAQTIMDDIVDAMLDNSRYAFVRGVDDIYSRKRGLLSDKQISWGVNRGVAEGIFEQPDAYDPMIFAIKPEKIENMPVPEAKY